MTDKGGQGDQTGQRLSIIPAGAIDDPQVSKAMLMVLSVLGCYSNKLGESFPSINTISARARMNRRDVQRHLRQLEKIGWIESRRRRREDGGESSSVFRIRLDFGLPPFQSESEGSGDSTRPPAGLAPAPPAGLAPAGPAGLAPAHNYPVNDSSNSQSPPDGGSGVKVKPKTRAKAPSTSDAALEGTLAQFLAAMPHSTHGTKASHAQLLTAFRVALKKTTPETIILAAKRYAAQEAAAGTKPQFIRAPINWLRGELWAAPAPSLQPELSPEAKDFEAQVKAWQDNGFKGPRPKLPISIKATETRNAA